MDLPDFRCLEDAMHAVGDHRGEEEGDSGGGSVGREGVQPREGEVKGGEDLRWEGGREGEDK